MVIMVITIIMMIMLVISRKILMIGHFVKGYAIDNEKSVGSSFEKKKKKPLVDYPWLFFFGIIKKN